MSKEDNNDEIENPESEDIQSEETTEHSSYKIPAKDDEQVKYQLSGMYQSWLSTMPPMSYWSVPYPIWMMV